MVFSLTTTTDGEIPGPGAIIKVGQARNYISAYLERTKKLEKAFDELPEGYPKPFDPNEESLGWVFSREVIDECLKQIPEDSKHVALVFGVGPRQVGKNGSGIPGSPLVLHAMMTAAKKIGDELYEIPAYGIGKVDDDNFGAEQGSSCCHGRLEECTQSLLTTGKVATIPAVL